MNGMPPRLYDIPGARETLTRALAWDEETTTCNLASDTDALDGIRKLIAELEEAARPACRPTHDENRQEITLTAPWAEGGIAVVAYEAKKLPGLIAVAGFRDKRSEKTVAPGLTPDIEWSTRGGVPRFWRRLEGLPRVDGQELPERDPQKGRRRPGMRDRPTNEERRRAEPRDALVIVAELVVHCFGKR